jgi:hypothetical protein
MGVLIVFTSHTSIDVLGHVLLAAPLACRSAA